MVIKADLGGDAGDHAKILAAFGNGGAVGSFAMSSIKMPRRHLSLLLLGWGVSGLLFIVIANASSISTSWPTRSAEVSK